MPRANGEPLKLAEAKMRRLSEGEVLVFGTYGAYASTEAEIAHNAILRDVPKWHRARIGSVVITEAELRAMVAALDAS